MTEKEWIKQLADLPVEHDDDGHCPADQMLEVIRAAQKEHPKSKHLKCLAYDWTDSGRTCPAPSVHRTCLDILDDKWPLPGTPWAEWYAKEDAE